MLLCLQTDIHAETSPEEITINADHMRLNIETGNSEYTGNVKISQGKLVLSGDKVILEQSNNEIENIIVVGKPARYNHITEKGDTIEAESERMVYNAGQNKLLMTGNARLQQPDQQVSSQTIIYDTLKKIVIAGGTKAASPADSSADSSESQAGDDATQKQRVNITLTPKKQPQAPADTEK